MKNKLLLYMFVFGFVGLTISIQGCSSNKDWRTASRESAGIAPDPLTTREAVVQVYGADAWGVEGAICHSYLDSCKAIRRKFYTVYDVVGWREKWGNPVLGVRRDIPDRYWYGEKPELLREHRGDEAEQLINEIEDAVNDYPWKNSYTVFPGPNSNTFTAWVALKVPKLDVKLPFSAIGSSYAKKNVL